MTDRDPLLAPFEALIGTWSTETKHRLMDEVVLGKATFEWLEGGQFIVLRSQYEHELLPDALSVIGRPESGDGLILEYFDSRGVRRTYAISLEGDVLRWGRDEPGFKQRNHAKLGPDGFELVGQLAQSADDWVDDIRTMYRRHA